MYSCLIISNSRHRKIFTNACCTTRQRLLNYKRLLNRSSEQSKLGKREFLISVLFVGDQARANHESASLYRAREPMTSARGYAGRASQSRVREPVPYARANQEGAGQIRMREAKTSQIHLFISTYKEEFWLNFQKKKRKTKNKLQPITVESSTK